MVFSVHSNTAGFEAEPWQRVRTAAKAFTTSGAERGRISGNYRKFLHAVGSGNTLHRLTKECAVAIPNRDAATGGQNTTGHRKTRYLESRR